MGWFHWLFPNWLEFWAFCASLTAVTLMTRRMLLAWPFNVLGATLYGIHFFLGGTYATAGLQVIFAGMALYGLWHWLHPRPGQPEVPVTRLPARQWGWYLPFAVAAAVGIGALLDAHTDSAHPYLDATPTAISLVAQWLQARKHIENWLVWIVANGVYIVLFLTYGWVATALLYAIFIGLAIVGWRQWRGGLREPAPATPGVAA